jgi:hypothetical protein
MGFILLEVVLLNTIEHRNVKPQVICNFCVKSILQRVNALLIKLIFFNKTE